MELPVERDRDSERGDNEDVFHSNYKSKFTKLMC